VWGKETEADYADLVECGKESIVGNYWNYEVWSDTFICRSEFSTSGSYVESRLLG
jgi:hypothetical protein